MVACSTTDTPRPPELIAAQTPATWKACRGAQAIWNEIPLVFRITNGRPFGVAGDRIATELVCAGVVRADSGTLPSEQATTSIAEVKALVEDRYRTIASKLSHPESSPRSFCVVLFNTTNQELSRRYDVHGASFIFRLQKAYAVLDDGDFVSSTPAPLHEIHRLRPGPAPSPEPLDPSIPRSDHEAHPTAAPWLAPHEPLLACEDTDVYGSVP
jgi:hypothetical protein